VPGTVGRAAAALAERVTPAALRKLVTLVLGASVGSMALPPTLLSSAGTSPVSTGAWATSAVGGTSLGPGYRPTPSGPHDPVASRRGRADPSDVTPVPGMVPATGVGPGYTPTTQPSRSPSAIPGVVRAAPGPAGPGFVPTPPVPVHDAEGAALLARPPRPTAAAHGLVTVRRGDTLWSIARRHLGAGASDAQVAREWPRWYAANRVVIGEDPDRILAGQQLVPPDARGAAPTRTKE
jgi:nucleoid-associated protein YgaU